MIFAIFFFNFLDFLFGTTRTTLVEFRCFIYLRFKVAYFCQKLSIFCFHQFEILFLCDRFLFELPYLQFFFLCLFLQKSLYLFALLSITIYTILLTSKTIFLGPQICPANHSITATPLLPNISIKFH